MNRRKSLWVVVALVALVGCDSAPRPVSVGTSEDVAKAREARAIFDASDGVWSSVSDEQRLRFIELMGDRATSAWQAMLKSSGKVHAPPPVPVVTDGLSDGTSTSS